MNFKDFITENTEFFDSVIADIEVCDRRVLLSIFEDWYENTFSNTRITIESNEEDSFIFLLKKEYAINHKMRARSREISFKRVKKMIKAGKSFVVADVKLFLSGEREIIDFMIYPCKNGWTRYYLSLELFGTSNILIEKNDGNEQKVLTRE